MTATRYTRLGNATPTTYIFFTPGLGYYGIGRVKGKTTHSTRYYPTEAEARTAIEEGVKTPSPAY